MKNNILFSLIILLLSASSSWATQIKYAFKPGASYEYELSSSSRSTSRALDKSFADNTAGKAINFTLKVIDFHKGAFIVDIKINDRTLRRYIKENGDIAGAPGETGKQIPFFLSFPTNDWQPGEKHLVNRPINLGRISVPANWNILLKSVDNDKEIAEIWFTANARLPEDKLRKKDFSLKGKLSFDMANGIINSAEWSTEYNFSFINKEIAVTRNLWNFTDKSIYSLRLVNIKE